MNKSPSPEIVLHRLHQKKSCDKAKQLHSQINRDFPKYVFEFGHCYNHIHMLIESDEQNLKKEVMDSNCCQNHALSTTISLQKIFPSDCIGGVLYKVFYS